jgi:hypothetical protein
MKTRKIPAFFAILILGAGAFCQSETGAPAIQAISLSSSKVGVNLGSITEYSTEFVWVDIARNMLYQYVGGIGASNIDSDGFPLSLSAGQRVDLGFGSGTNHVWPEGDYNVYYDGSGEITARAATRLVSNDNKGHMVFKVDHSNDWFGFSITKTDPANRLRNLRIIMPGFEKTYKIEPLHPSFVEHWKDFKVFRFMDFSHTNGSSVVEWADVRKKTSISQNDAETGFNDGSSPEYAVEICNMMLKDPWFCIPHKASDDCIRRWATMVRDKLDSRLKVYLEYSNEVWNWGFPQAGYSRTMARNVLKLPSSAGALEYYVYRSSQIYKIWEDVFGDAKDRIVKVAAWQNANPYWVDKMMEWFGGKKYNPTGSKPDAIATAPYLDGLKPDETDGWTNTADVFTFLQSQKLESIRSFVRQNMASARKYKVRYLAYEGGQHLVSQNDEKLTSLYIAANRDPRMYNLYANYLRMWQSEAGDLFCMYNSCGSYSKYGSWGALETYGQDTNTAYKYNAIVDFARKSSL